MARSYRDVETARITTDPSLMAAAEAALSLLRQIGGPASSPGDDSSISWQVDTAGPTGTRMVVCCTGPTLPSTIPDEIVRPGDIAKDRPFVGAWRLVIKAPILVLDLTWQADMPLRIMTFANGDWQQELTILAQQATGKLG